MVVDFEEALKLVLGAGWTRVAETERVALLDAAGRVLAESILADRDQPAFNRSTRDGFAVRAAELKTGAVHVVGEVRAGAVWKGELSGASAVQIMTGAPVPAGADAVVMIEHVGFAEEKVTLAPGRVLSAGDNIVPCGAEARVGDEVVARGVRIGAAEIALAASCGYAHVQVVRRPKIAIVATGDELVEVAAQPAEQQIRNSNSYAIAAMVANAGGEPVRLPVARDTREEVRASVVEGRKSDLLVFSGGVSMGEYDLVEEVLAEFGAEFLFTGVMLQPGKPLVFGRLPARGADRECFFFGLPGNPISTQVTFHCFAELAVRYLGGESVSGPRWAQATLAEAVAAKSGLTRLLPCRMDGVAARLVGWQGSGDLAANARANCYAELLPGRAYSAGEVLRVLLR